MREKFFKTEPMQEEIKEFAENPEVIEKVKEVEAVIVPIDRGVVLGDKPCYIRESSSVSSKVIGQLNPSQEISVCDEVYVGGQKKPVWYQIKLKNGDIGFVSAGHIEIL